MIQMNSLTAALMIASFALVPACTWVKPTAAGTDVQLSAAEGISDCQKLGKVNVSVKDRIGRMNRKATKVESELQTLARNEAAVMGGDTIVAESGVDSGRQEYGVYDCR